MRNGMNVHTDKKRGNKDKGEYPLPGMGCKCTRVSDDRHEKWSWKMDCGFIQYNFSFLVIKILMFEINATFKIGFKSFSPREF